MEPYRYHFELPDGYSQSSGKTFPLILFLHGGGENGDKEGRNYVQQVKFHGPWKAHGCTEYMKGPEAIKKISQFFVVAPHLPSGVEWDAESVRAVLDEVVERPNYRKSIDRNRLYLTGVSWGGRGVSRVALDDPQTFAAIVPICAYGGGEFVSRIGQLKDLPIWLFHGDRDGLEDPKKQDPRRFGENSRELYEGLEGDNNKEAHLTIYPGEGHSGAWIKAYNDPALYDWLLEHSKAK